MVTTLILQGQDCARVSDCSNGGTVPDEANVIQGLNGISCNGTVVVNDNEDSTACSNCWHASLKMWHCSKRSSSALMFSRMAELKAMHSSAIWRHCAVTSHCGHDNGGEQNLER